MGCGASKKEEEPTPPPAAAIGRKRGSVAAQGGIDPTKMTVNLATMPKIEKSAEAMERISQCVSKNLLMKALSKEYKDAVIASMKEVSVAKDEYIIKQGEAGDTWYVVDSGHFTAYKVVEKDEAPPGHVVKEYEVGTSFGELALMYNQRRAASVVAKEDSKVWAVSQEVFKQLILTSSQQNKESYS